MTSLQAFVKAAPVDFQPCTQPGRACYKYFVHGKGCTLGVLFETSTAIHFEWLTERGEAVRYEPDIRYKAWRKCEFERLLREGVWEVSSEGPITREAHGAHV